MLISGHIMWDISQTVVTIPSDFMWVFMENVLISPAV